MNKAELLARVIGDTIVELADEEPQGVPSGTVYAALMGYGVTLSLYQGILDALGAAGRVKVKSHCIYSTKEVTS